MTIYVFVVVSADTNGVKLSERPPTQCQTQQIDWPQKLRTKARNYNKTYFGKSCTQWFCGHIAFPNFGE